MSSEVLTMRPLSVALLVAACAASAPAQASTVVVEQPAPAPTQEAERPWGGPMSQHVWIDARAGVEYVNMQTFIADFNNVSAGLLPTSGIGPAASVGAGLRFGFFTVGARGGVSSFDSAITPSGAWQLWTLDAELGMRVPLGRLEPHVAFAGGYSSFGNFGTAVAGLGDGIDVHGLDLRVSGGADYWIAHAVSLGVDVSGGLLAVARPGVSVRDLATAKQIGTLDDAKARVLEASGTSVGTRLGLTAGVAVHF